MTLLCMQNLPEAITNTNSVLGMVDYRLGIIGITSTDISLLHILKITQCKKRDKRFVVIQ